MAGASRHPRGGASADKETLKLSWAEVLGANAMLPMAIPEGYSTTRQIAERSGMAVSHVTRRMNDARRLGRVECRRVRLEGHVTWVYKDPE